MKNAVLIFTVVLTVIFCGCSVKTQEHANIETAIKSEVAEMIAEELKAEEEENKTEEPEPEQNNKKKKKKSAAKPVVTETVIYSQTGEHILKTVDKLTYVDDILVVNKTYSIPSSYGKGLTSKTKSAFSKMAGDAKNDGINLRIASGYRSYSTQKYIYNRYYKRDGKIADTYSARPGHSEHQTGMAIDVNSCNDNFGNTPEGMWLAEHCAEYGFIIRYPKGKDEITGYKYEPWHIRYVGKEWALKITESGLCFEEYFGIDSAYKN